MRHVPHLLLGRPWPGGSLPLSDDRAGHLFRVLRMRRHDSVSYTDGNGVFGQGRLGDGVVERGTEREVPRSNRLIVAVAPPESRDRARFLVEKLAELGVARLEWLATRHGEGRAPSAAKSRAWAVAALEQSRSAWLLEVGETPVGLELLRRPLVICHPEGDRLAPEGVSTVAIGPEGGWDEAELPSDALRLGLGPTVLRVETAAVVAAARLI